MIAGFEMPDAGRIRFGGAGRHRPSRPTSATSASCSRTTRCFRTCRSSRTSPTACACAASPAAEIAQRVGEVLALVGLAGYEQQFSGQLSGGEQQRVALARAIVIRPRVLLFDEPLSNLDAKLRVQMRHEIRDLQRRLAITTVYVTHDQEEAMAVSDRIAVMNEGSVVQEGTAEDLYHRPASQFVAQFVGRVNLVAGRVAAVAGDAVDGRGAGHDDRRARACAPGLAPGDRGAARAAARSDRDRRRRRRAADRCRRRSPRARSSARRSNTCCAAAARRCRSCATTPGPATSSPKARRRACASRRTP